LSSEPNAQIERGDTVDFAPALTLVESTGEPREQEKASPRWGFAQKVLFRFAFCYLVLYNLPFPLDYVFFTTNVAKPYQDLWNFVVPWVGEDVLNVDPSVLPNGSGDTTYNYVQVFCFLMLALAATAIWTFLDRKRANYARLHEWLRVYVRFALALTMIGYGAAKVIPSQFPAPSLDRLLQPYGDSSPMGLLWTFMGASLTYSVFGGLSEMLGGLLLILRRTTLLGALVCIGVMTNVVLLNFSYDVPVKLFSSHLLLMAIFLTLPDLRRLANLLVFNRRVEPAEIRPLFRSKWLHRSALALRTVFFVGFTIFLLNQAYQGIKQYGSLAPKPPLYGIWNVEDFVVDGQARPPLITDESRWRRVVFDYPGTIAVQLMGDSRQRYRLALDSGKKSLALTKRDDPQWRSRLSYRQPEPQILAMEGTFDGHKVQARLRRVDESKFLLVNRGFHWINEYPFNR
jgi:hypothetical protein